MNVFIGLFIILFITVSLILAYALICDYKRNQLLKLFKIIKDRASTRKSRENAANKAIKIMHGHKFLYPPSVISININENRDNPYLAFELLKAEIKHLLKSINSLHSQKTFLNAIPPENLVKNLEFITETNKILTNIDFAPIAIFEKVYLLSAAYRAVAKRYATLPDENNHSALNFMPLFEIIDKTPARTIKILPYLQIPA